MSLDQLQRLNVALAGRYAIERELGKGGTATVYLAEDLKHRRHVALKVLHPEVASALGTSRFLREIAIAARLSAAIVEEDALSLDEIFVAHASASARQQLISQ